MNNSLHDFTSGVKRPEIATTEQTIGVKFPDDLVKFWEAHQGGWPENDIFDYVDIDGVSNEGQVMSFLLLDEKDEGVTKKTLSLQKENRILDCHVVIADEAGGHKILYNSDDGKIYVWDHENEDLVPKNCYPIADSFTHFFYTILHQLEVDEDYS